MVEKSGANKRIEAVCSRVADYIERNLTPKGILIKEIGSAFCITPAAAEFIVNSLGCEVDESSEGFIVTNGPTRSAEQASLKIRPMGAKK